MALNVRRDSLPFKTEIDTTKLSAASHKVSRITGFPVQYNKAIVGKNAFAHESGIHQDGMLKNAETYEIMRPEDVGVAKMSLVMGKHSGRHAFKDKMISLGHDLDREALNEAFVRFKDLADRKKHVFDDDLLALIDDQLAAAGERIGFDRLRVVAGSEGPQSAHLEITVDGDSCVAETNGNGPVDAVFNAIRTCVPHAAKLDLFQVHAVTGGTDAQAEVSVRLKDTGIMAMGRASDPDTLVASAKAYINALNKLDNRQLKRLDQ
ncbi:MAG: 2-isopropylmalate synthase [Hyphomonas sp. TMED17]|nr:MAG: 2-isopropylmalate synthase [Hyphomonas sp. TMED17]